MGALLGDVAVFQNQNLVRVLDGGQAVGDDEAGFALHEPAHGCLHLALGAGVHVAGGLVQNQHLRVIEHGPGDGQQLLLALADIAAVLGDDGVVAPGQAHDVAVDVAALAAATTSAMVAFSLP